MSDNRANIKADPDVKERFDDKKPPELTQSEFIAQLLDEATFNEGVTAEEVRQIVRDELETFKSELRR